MRKSWQELALGSSDGKLAAPDAESINGGKAQRGWYSVKVMSGELSGLRREC